MAPPPELAAHLGEPAAARSLGVAVAADDDLDLSTWAWGFSRWGQETMVRAALAAARLALPVWQGYRAPDEVEAGVFGGAALREALDVVAAWLADDVRARAQISDRAALTRDMVSDVSFYTEEASGSGEVVARRERALAAARAVLATVEAAAWREEDARQEVASPEADAAEVAARVAAGPALHVVRALSYACVATGATAGQVRAELRRVLLGPGAGAGR